MSKEDYTFMKSGFDLTAPPTDNEFRENTTAILVTFTSEALRSAAIYVSHGPREVVTTEDIKRAMMLELFLFNKRPDLLDKANEIKKELYGEDDVEDIDDEALNNAIVSDEEMEPFAENNCECALCKAINTIYTRWNNWTPTSEFEKVFMKRIEEMG